jgi:hypothetical protein
MHGWWNPVTGFYPKRGGGMSGFSGKKALHDGKD